MYILQSYNFLLQTQKSEDLNFTSWKCAIKHCNLNKISSHTAEQTWEQKLRSYHPSACVQNKPISTEAFSSHRPRIKKVRLCTDNSLLLFLTVQGHHKGRKNKCIGEDNSFGFFRQQCTIICCVTSKSITPLLLEQLLCGN